MTEGRSTTALSGYFVLRSSEDGISIKGPMTAPEFKKFLATYAADNEEEPRFYDSMPNVYKGFFDEGGRDEGRMLVIRGEILVPVAAEKVTVWEVPDV